MCAQVELGFEPVRQVLYQNQLKFYSRLLKKEEKPDYWAMVKRDAEKAPPVKIVLRPEREKRTSKELPSYVTDEAHKKAAQEEIMKKMFKSKR